MQHLRINPSPDCDQRSAPPPFDELAVHEVPVSVSDMDIVELL
jgi:hypothetical protein